MKKGIATDGWKTTPQHYVDSCKTLLDNMSANGYAADAPIPVDNDGEIWNGAHRIACAAAIGFKEIPVYHKEGNVWAPDWGRQWFVQKGIWKHDLKRLDKDMEKLKSA